MARKQYFMAMAGISSVELQFSLGDSQYSAPLLAKMGLSTTAPTASATKLIIPVTEEKAVEIFGCIPVAVSIEPPTGATGAAARPRTQTMVIGPGKTINGLVGETYDGRKILTARPYTPEAWK